MFNGSGVAIVTPFENGKIDFESFERLIDFHLENDTQALIVLGTTGESSTQTNEEEEELISTAIKRVGGRIPVIIGTGSNCTDSAVYYTKKAESLGADGVLVVTPYYNKATQNGLIEHYTTVANATTLPVILYNVPGRTGTNLEAKTVAALSKVENIVGVKEASGDICQVLEIKRLVPEDFKIYSGNDDQIIPIYACGGHGVISVCANAIPKQTQQMCKAFMDGDVKEALRLQLLYKHFINLLFCEVNPIPIKAALNAMGYIKDELRLPLTSMEDVNRNKLLEEMENLNII
ncbi:MAG TPA: 4-hydroxy-tetrahydrodipicolinate synthase [Oscillospiraceae bacterium]|nr:4-hydroxy-tetrahydrodipicolinate synthase [Oscillospiraceae bacterium]